MSENNIPFPINLLLSFFRIQEGEQFARIHSLGFGALRKWNLMMASQNDI